MLKLFFGNCPTPRIPKQSVVVVVVAVIHTYKRSNISVKYYAFNNIFVAKLFWFSVHFDNIIHLTNEFNIY